MAEPIPIFCGPSYSSQSLNAAAQQSMNWYVEQMEVPGENQQLVLYPTPGLEVYSPANPGLQTRGSWQINDRAFIAISNALYEIPATAGAFTFLGNIANDLLPVSMIAYGDQLLIASATQAYVFTLSTNVLAVVVDLVGVNVAKVDYCGGFFIALVGDTNTFRISDALDATIWDPLDFAQITIFSGNLLSMIVDHNEIWLWSGLASTVYYLSGNTDFPFDVNPSTQVIEAGIAAINSVAKLDNTIFWIGKDTRGRGVIWKASGYTPTRVSNHAMENAISGYGDISDAVAYSYQDQGHGFYVLYFPTAEVLPHETRSHTWVYDVATGMWHERGFWDSRLAEYEAHHSWNHVFFQNKHLVGDWSSGNLYNMSIMLLDDVGDEIRRVRRAPHVSLNQMWSFHNQLQVFVQPGVGPMPPLLDGAGNPRDPIMNLRWSDDGAQTWSNEVSVGVGQAGEYAKRVMFRRFRLGRARDRVYEISVSDPVFWRIINAFLDVEPGIS